ncbi:hypothetical protein COO20_07110 [Thalassospira marina]|uniref:Uncharacterized protein n=1 Tax=Thalassospira marina TaxID=2048283 RepID=A0A2N3KX37_9PROT|nr:hypothetical protein COO20_07110 [Thalassospira marina]
MCGLAFEAVFNGLCARLQEGKRKTSILDVKILFWALPGRAGKRLGRLEGGHRDGSGYVLCAPAGSALVLWSDWAGYGLH